MKTEDGEEQWILAEVFSYSSQNHRYSVDDIDEEGHNEQRWARRHDCDLVIVLSPLLSGDTMLVRDG